MKKILLSILVAATGFVAQSQVICSVQSPGNIAGNLNFTWAQPGSGWGTTDMANSPGYFVQGDLILVNDGTPGTNATYGNLLSEEGCNPSPLNAYAGKIAILRRNTCNFSTKALNAQNAGAIAVIIINRDPEPIAMGAGTDGASVTIPTVMIGSTDGATLLTELLSGPVNVLIGNKTGLFADDIGIKTGSSLLPKSSGVPSQLAQSAADFNFDLGTRIYNYGTNAQSNISITATVDGPSGNVFTQTLTSISIASGDSLDVSPVDLFSFNQFVFPAYPAPAGRYTLKYMVDLGATDDYAADNTVQTDFVISDTLFSYAALDVTTNLPVANNGYRPSNNNSTFSICYNISHPNASRIGVAGIYFSASTSSASGVPLTGEEIALNLYRWDDAFADLNDAGLAFNNLTSVAFGYYYFPSDLQSTMVYGAFNTPVLLTDNQRYLACIQTVNTNVYLGHDTKTDYTWNQDYYLQPLTPNESDGTYYAAGFGADAISAMGLRVFSANQLSIAENTSVQVSAFPNPTTDNVTISAAAEGNASLNVTDVSGKVVLTNNLDLSTGNVNVNLSSLEAGMYIFNVTFENGKTSQFNIVKK